MNTVAPRRNAAAAAREILHGLGVLGQGPAPVPPPLPAHRYARRLMVPVSIAWATGADIADEDVYAADDSYVPGANSEADLDATLAQDAADWALARGGRS